MLPGYFATESLVRAFIAVNANEVVEALLLPQEVEGSGLGGSEPSKSGACVCDGDSIRDDHAHCVVAGCRVSTT